MEFSMILQRMPAMGEIRWIADRSIGPKKATSDGLLIVPTEPKEAISGRLRPDTPTETSWSRNSVDSY
jgi:hypothetical protein